MKNLGKKILELAEYLGCNGEELKNELQKEIIPEVIKSILPEEHETYFQSTSTGNSKDNNWNYCRNWIIRKANKLYKIKL